MQRCILDASGKTGRIYIIQNPKKFPQYCTRLSCLKIHISNRYYQVRTRTRAKRYARARAQ